MPDLTRLACILNASAPETAFVEVLAGDRVVATLVQQNGWRPGILVTDTVATLPPGQLFRLPAITGRPRYDGHAYVHLAERAGVDTAYVGRTYTPPPMSRAARAASLTA